MKNKRINSIAVLAIIALVGLSPIGTTNVNAASLDSVIQEEVQDSSNTTNETTSNNAVVEESGNTDTVNDGSNSLGYLKDATNLTGSSAGAEKINSGTKTVATFLVQILSYFITAFLAVRCLLDICYITLPFTREALAKGRQGTPVGGGQQQPGAPMGGMSPMGGGMRPMGMGGMQGGMGSMGGMGGMGGMSPMGGMQGQPQQSMGTQLVSNAALNAVATEQANNTPAIKVYGKDMVVVLVLTAVLVVLAVTGVLTDFGFLLGEVITKFIGSIGNFI